MELKTSRRELQGFEKDIKFIVRLKSLNKYFIPCFS